MYARKEIINEIESLYKEIDLCQNDILYARLAKDCDREKKALDKLESIVIGVQQDLTVIHTYLKEHPDWQDIRSITQIADRLIGFAGENNWTEEDYYKAILEQWTTNEK